MKTKKSNYKNLITVVLNAVMLSLSFMFLCVSVYAWFANLPLSVGNENKLLDNISDGFDIKLIIDNQDVTNSEIVFGDILPKKIVKVIFQIVSKTPIDNLSFKMSLGKIEGQLFIFETEKYETSEEVLEFYLTSDLFLDYYDNEVINQIDNKIADRKNYKDIFDNYYTLKTIQSNGGLIGQMTKEFDSEISKFNIVFYFIVNDRDPNDEIDDIDRFQGSILKFSKLNLIIKSD